MCQNFIERSRCDGKLLKAREGGNCMLFHFPFVLPSSLVTHYMKSVHSKWLRGYLHKLYTHWVYLNNSVWMVRGGSKEEFHFACSQYEMSSKPKLYLIERIKFNHGMKTQHDLHGIKWISKAYQYYWNIHWKI